ncbi:disulfide bond formation protein B [Candidatus Puniceispirillum sp.]|nr:disulfide bond formation protein B [Candidatus Puniceispirillum sp.]
MAYQIKRTFIPPIGQRLGLTIAGGISITLLGGALLFQYAGGLAPCSLCIWQRWPHLAVIVVAFIGLRGVMPRVMLWLTFIAGSVSVGLGSYHAGIEYGFWAGPTGCSANFLLEGDIKAQTQQLLITPLVRCDEVTWSLFGLSMAGWNALISLDIMAAALISLRRS